MKWEDIFNTGCVVDLSTSMWHARVKIKPSDFGIEDSADVRKALSLGSHRLMPQKSFDAIVAPIREARRLVDYYSVNFGLIRGARFVPSKNLKKLVDELKAQKAAFTDAVNEFVDGYDDAKREMLPVIARALAEAAHTKEAADDALDRLRAEYPSAEDMRDRFSMAWSVYTISSPKSAGALAEEKENVKGIVRSMVTQLRSEMADKLGDLLKVLDKGGKPNKRSVESANELLSRLDDLNVFGDSELSEQIEVVRRWVGTFDGEQVDERAASGIAEVKRTIEQGMEAAVAAAEANLTGVGRRKFAKKGA